MSRDPDVRPDGGSTGLTTGEPVPLVDEDADAATLTPAVPDRATICVVGLGYVGLPLATAFDDADQEVIGYDIDRAKVDRLSNGFDPTDDVGDRRVTESTVEFTADPSAIAAAEYVIVTVPTPIDDQQNPDLAYVEAAGETVGEHLSRGATVVLESTVVPGTTESVLAPAVESTSGLTVDEDFSVAYSPERASPGDEGRGVSDVVKIVGAADDETRDELAQLYGRIVDAGVYRAPDIETAETAKVIENVQRDLNIALVNELAIACDYMGISTEEVLDAAGTKWNFHDEYEPGLVGGHCIPVDPHFLAHRSERDGFSPKLVLQAREINTYLPTHAADLVVRALNDARKVLGDSRVLVLGLSYKANVGDIRTSEVSGVIAELETFDVDVVGYDPHADQDAARETFDIDVQSSLDATGCDAVIVATDHDAFADVNLDVLADAMAPDPVLVDVAGAFDAAAARDAGFAVRQL